MQDKATNWKNNTHRCWWRDPGLRKNVAWVALLYFGCFVLGYDGSLLNGLQALPQWNKAFDSPAGIRLGLISASLYFPQLISTPFVPWLCDTYGRRVALLLGSVGVIVGAIVTSLAQSVITFIAGRIVTGLFSGFQLISSMCLMNELIHPRLRGLGGCIAAWATFGGSYWDSDWSWRLPCLLQAVGPAILLFVAIFGPESPRFLVSIGKRQDSLDILARFHANGDRQDGLVQEELREIFTHIRNEKEASTQGWRSLIATRGNRRRLLIVTIIGSGGSLIGSNGSDLFLSPANTQIGWDLGSHEDMRVFYLSSSTHPLISLSAALVNGGLGLFNVVMTIVGGLCVDRVGRRALFLISTSGVLLSYVVIIGLSAGFTMNPSPSIGFAFIVMLFLCCGSFDLAWPPLSQLYLVEILPFSIRSKAIAWASFLSNCGVVFNGLLNPIALDAWQWRYYFMFLGIQIIYLVLIWWLFLETRGRTIEQVSVLFDQEACPIYEHDSEKSLTNIEF